MKAAPREGIVPAVGTDALGSVNGGVSGSGTDAAAPMAPATAAQCWGPSQVCPNCGAALIARKCKLLCPRPGCGYLVTCSEW